MKRADLSGRGVVGLGYGEAEGSHRDAYARRVSSVVRYADPAAWCVVAAIDRALESVAGGRDVAGEGVGLALVSESGPVETMSTVAASVREGFVSPMRFAAATPASLAGLACIVFGFKGPTLTLTMPAEQGLAVAETVAANWLGRGAAELVLLLTCAFKNGAGPAATCRVLGRKEPGGRT